ncbi:hypothetical protein [Ezakiella coagulans]|uniref:hypothetical protein n=1 Tax=Ezakiella coagulans TaxID=46507 RepID=UPI002889DA80|nr:hypothetical protein [Ezakiella coagulans]
MSDKLATVTGFFDSGAAKVKFDGEEEESKKEYPFMKHCIPKEGDRVYMKEFADSYIIYGVVLFETAPEKLDGTEGDWTVNGVVKAKSAEIKENLRAAMLEGKLTGDVKGNVTGDLTGNVKGNVEGKVKGDVEGNVKGNLTGNVTGNVKGSLTGNVNGSLSGSYVSVSGTLTGRALNVPGLKVNSSGYISFFGRNYCGQSRVATLSQNAALNTVTAKVNELINTLSKYGFA